MNVTDTWGIVTPDENTPDDVPAWSAAMASSIVNGLGAAMDLQQSAVGLLAGVNPGTRVKFAQNIITPYEILPGTPCYVRGLEFNEGIAKIKTKGIYAISASASLQPWDSWGQNTYNPENQNRSIALEILKNGQPFGGGEVPADQYFWATANDVKFVQLAENDTICCYWHSAALSSNGTEPAAGAMVSENWTISTLSVALITPLP